MLLCPPSHSSFKPRVRRYYYADLAFAVSSPRLGKMAIPDHIYTISLKVCYNNKEILRTFA
jgi:hypothetical protein